MNVTVPKVIRTSSCRRRMLNGRVRVFIANVVDVPASDLTLHANYAVVAAEFGLTSDEVKVACERLLLTSDGRRLL